MSEASISILPWNNGNCFIRVISGVSEAHQSAPLSSSYKLTWKNNSGKRTLFMFYVTFPYQPDILGSQITTQYFGFTVTSQPYTPPVCPFGRGIKSVHWLMFTSPHLWSPARFSFPSLGLPLSSCHQGKQNTVAIETAREERNHRHFQWKERGPYMVISCLLPLGQVLSWVLQNVAFRKCFVRCVCRSA